MTKASTSRHKHVFSLLVCRVRWRHVGQTVVKLRMQLGMTQEKLAAMSKVRMRTV